MKPFPSSESIKASGAWRRVAVSLLPQPAWLIWMLLGLGANANAATNSLAQTNPKLLGDLGELDRLEIMGANTFSADQLREALKQTSDFWQMTHPCAPRAEYLKALEKKLETGYLHAGFAQARVTARIAPETQRVVVTVNEGRRYLCGNLVVSGVDPELKAKLLKHLTIEPPPEVQTGSFVFVDKAPSSNDSEPQTPGWVESRWVPGQPAHFAEYDLVWLRWAVADKLREEGFSFPKFDVTIRRERVAAKAELRLAVRELGPRRTVGRIEFSGNHKDGIEALLHYLDLKPGMELTRQRIAALEDRLWRSARFLSYKIHIGERDAAGRVPLRVELVEYAEAPGVAQEFSPVEQAMLKVRDWLATLDKTQEELVGEMSPPSGPGWTVVLSPQKGLAVAAGNDRAVLNGPLVYGLVVQPAALGLYSPERNRKLVIPCPTMKCKTFAKMEPKDPAGDGDRFNLTFGAGFDSNDDASESPYQFTLSLAPVACLSLAHQTNGTYSFVGGELIFSNSDSAFRSDATTGRIVELAFHRDTEPRNVWGRFNFQRGAFEHAAKAIEACSAGQADAFRTNAALSSPLSFVLEETLCSKLLAPAMSRLNPALPALAPALAAGLNLTNTLAPLDQLLPQKNPAKGRKDDFSVPEFTSANGGGNNPMQVFGTWGLALGEKLLTRPSWPWSLTRELALMLKRQTRYADRGFQQLCESKGTGPLGCWVIGQIVKNPALTRRFAERGQQRLAAADFSSDCQLFLDEKSVLGQCLARLVGRLGELDETQARQLAALFPPASGAFIQDCARRLQGDRTKSVAALLAPAFELYWENELKPKMAAQLKQLGGH